MHLESKLRLWYLQQNTAEYRLLLVLLSISSKPAHKCSFRYTDNVTDCAALNFACFLNILEPFVVWRSKHGNFWFADKAALDNLKHISFQNCTKSYLESLVIGKLNFKQKINKIIMQSKLNERQQTERKPRYDLWMNRLKHFGYIRTLEFCIFAFMT